MEINNKNSYNMCIYFLIMQKYSCHSYKFCSYNIFILYIYKII